MKKIVFLMMTVALAFVIVSCDDKVESYPPVFEGFQVSPAQPHPGDSITVTAKIKKKASHIYGAKYSWKLTVYYTDETTEEVKDTTYSSGTITVPSTGEQYTEPTYRFRIPDNALTTGNTYSYATVSFGASYNNSATGPENASYTAGTGEDCFGTITSSAATLYSKASGSGKFRIYAK